MKHRDFTLYPEEIRGLIEKLGSPEGMTRLRSRNTLVKLGISYLPYYEMLLHSGDRLMRWESAKIIESLGDESSIPLFIILLEDPEDEIRWIAAEGLISTGKKSIRPVLNELISNGDSFFMKIGAHHVLKSLSHGREREKLTRLLRALHNYGEQGELVALEASKVLRSIDDIIDFHEGDRRPSAKSNTGRETLPGLWPDS